MSDPNKLGPDPDPITTVKVKVKTSVGDPGYLSWIPDTTFFHPGSRIQIFSIPDPHQRI
jgi:hypothetical protein